MQFDDAIDDGDLREVIGTFVAETCQDLPTPDSAKWPTAILQDHLTPTEAAQ